MKYLICPLCSESLFVTSQGVACINRHQFDRAKEGYFNLLPVQHKNSREPGDAKQQLQARRSFLQAGFFLPLLQSIQHLVSPNAESVLDIGCGEGYFTRGIAETCLEAEVYGLDIAKAGVRLAAKSININPEHGTERSNLHCSNQTYIVASSYLLPLKTSSMDAVVRIYAPSKDEELLRVIKPNGKLIIITPSENHLLALRNRIYRELRLHPKPHAPQGFAEFSQQVLTYSLNVPAGEYTQSLLQMTPFAWRLNPILMDQIVSEGLNDTAGFQLSVYHPV